MTQQPLVDPGPHHYRGFTNTLRHTKASSGRVISPTQKPLSDNTWHPCPRLDSNPQSQQESRNGTAAGIDIIRTCTNSYLRITVAVRCKARLKALNCWVPRLESRWGRWLSFSLGLFFVTYVAVSGTHRVCVCVCLILWDLAISHRGGLGLMSAAPQKWISCRIK